MASNTPITSAPNTNATLGNENPSVADMGLGNSKIQTGVGANGMKITEHIFSDTSWPANLSLDLGKSNWQEWH